MAEKKTFTGMIYKLYNTEEPDQFYVGSTIQKYLSSRLATHKADSQMDKHKHVKLYQYVNNLPDKWKTMKIELLEKFEQVTKDILRTHEGKYKTELKAPLNTYTAGAMKEGLTEYRKKWREDHQEYLRKWRLDHQDYNKNWRKEHEDEMKEYLKKYYEKNHDAIKQRQKDYYHKNAEKWKQYQKQYREKKKEQKENTI